MDFLGDRSQLCHGTLILPALSIGNAGQLAVDLLISSYEAVKVGYLDDPYALPCVGNDAFGPVAQGTLTVAVELYVDSSRGVTILQQRSPLVKGSALKHASCLADWIQAEGFKQVVVISGLDAGTRRFHLAERSVVYYMYNRTDGGDELCQGLGWKEVEQSQATDGAFDFSSMRDGLEDEHDGKYLSKLPVTLLFSCCQARGVKVLSVLSYCCEGDNVPDAFFLAAAVNKFLHSECERWRIPLSWSTVYGAAPDQSIYL